jgi:tetratricopeptide (TPR) repeat protein
MSYVTRKNNFQKICLSVFIVSLVSICGCTSAEEKRARCHDEIVTLYNEHIEEASTISNTEIMSKCDQAIEQFPDLAIAYELKGLLLWGEGKLKPAWENYRKALELAPFDEDTLANAREVASQLNGTLVNVDESGKVQTVPFKNISLDEYGQCTEEVRFNLCLIGLGIGEKVKRKVLAGSTTKTYVFGLVSRICGDNQVPATCQVRDIARFPDISGS